MPLNSLQETTFLDRIQPHFPLARFFRCFLFSVSPLSLRLYYACYGSCPVEPNVTTALEGSLPS